MPLTADAEATITEDLIAGYGVDDIALRWGFDKLDIWEFIGVMRASGELSAMYEFRTSCSGIADTNRGS